MPKSTLAKDGSPSTSWATQEDGSASSLDWFDQTSSSSLYFCTHFLCIFWRCERTLFWIASHSFESQSNPFPPQVKSQISLLVFQLYLSSAHQFRSQHLLLHLGHYCLNQLFWICQAIFIFSQPSFSPFLSLFHL